MSQDSSVWNNIAVFCQHLAPVLGPLAQAAGNTAQAVDAAERETRGLQARQTYYRTLPIPQVADEELGL